MSIAIDSFHVTTFSLILVVYSWALLRALWLLTKGEGWGCGVTTRGKSELGYRYLKFRLKLGTEIGSKMESAF